jgi:hypothetical protein
VIRLIEGQKIEYMLFVVVRFHAAGAGSADRAANLSADFPSSISVPSRTFPKDQVGLDCCDFPLLTDVAMLPNQTRHLLKQGWFHKGR